MATYIILSRISPNAFENPRDFRKVAQTVAGKIRKECKGCVWKASYAVMGRFDVVDIVEANDPAEVERAAMIIRGYGRSSTETLAATPWQDFLDSLK
jgi:uncharacterized protein with GYD domain